MQHEPCSQRNICLQCNRCCVTTAVLLGPFPHSCVLLPSAAVCETHCCCCCSSFLSQPSVYCGPVTSNLSSCCQIPQREKETANEKDRGEVSSRDTRRIDSFFHLYNFLSGVFHKGGTLVERVKYCLPLNHRLCELDVSQLALKILFSSCCLLTLLF